MRLHFLSRIGLLSWFGLAILCGCASSHPMQTDPSRAEIGIASYYAHKFHGRKTASGEVYNQEFLTAAHRKLPFGTQVRVTNLSNGKHVTLKINDRGPFVEGRIIDVSYRAARDLDFLKEGLVKVRVEVLETAD